MRQVAEKSKADKLVETQAKLLEEYSKLTSFFSDAIEVGSKVYTIHEAKDCFELMRKSLIRRLKNITAIHEEYEGFKTQIKETE